MAFFQIFTTESQRAQRKIKKARRMNSIDPSLDPILFLDFSL